MPPNELNGDDLLGDLLKKVSRSFYLTIRVLPEGLRTPIGLAYLLARAADTIADTTLVPPELRLELLLGFRAHVNGLKHESTPGRIQYALSDSQENPHERVLLQSLTPALKLLDSLSQKDLTEVRAVVTTLTQGMELDLRTFPPEDSGRIVALKNLEELENYTYYVAGCVGAFWTKMTTAYSPALRDWNVEEMSRRGVRFGKALQYTNVLRDCGKDARHGRCYLPREMLQPLGLAPEDVLNPANSARARPLLFELLRVALAHYREAQSYLLAIPPGQGRLRLACLWPIVIGLETLRQLAANEEWLDPAKKSKVSRHYVYRSMAISLPAVGSDTIVRGWIDRQIEAVGAIVS